MSERLRVAYLEEHQKRILEAVHNLPNNGKLRAKLKTAGTVYGNRREEEPNWGLSKFSLSPEGSIDMDDERKDEEEPIIVVSPLNPSADPTKGLPGVSGKITGGELDIVGEVCPVAVSLTPYWNSDDFYWDVYGLIKAPVLSRQSEGDPSGIPQLSDMRDSESVKAVKLRLGEKLKILVSVSLAPEMAEDMAAALIKGVVRFSPDRAEAICAAVMQAIEKGIEEAAEAKVQREEFEKSIKGVLPAEPPGW